MTDREEIALTGAQETLLAPLYGRALNSRAANPILVDHEAERAVQRLDYDFHRTKINQSLASSVAVRAKAFDRWTSRLLDEQPNSVVLHMGCGLDTRAHRIAPPSSARWHDIDLPEVIDLRRRVLPQREDDHTFACSVTDPHLLDDIPVDRPVLAVAEGLTRYLSKEDGQALVRRITERFPRGVLLFDILSPFGLRLARRQGIVRNSGARMDWVMKDPRELTTVVPGLTLDSAWNYHDAAQLERYSWLIRKLGHAASHIRPIRDRRRIVCYRFGE